MRIKVLPQSSLIQPVHCKQEVGLGFQTKKEPLAFDTSIISDHTCIITSNLEMEHFYAT